MIRRSGNSEGKSFRLDVEQTLHMDPKKDLCVHHVSADIHCRNDVLVSPMSWIFSSRFTRGPDAQQIPEAGHSEKARVTGKRLNVRIGTQSFQRNVSDTFTSDWSLFEAVPRLPFDGNSTLEFGLLEGLTVWKADQRLSYRGKFPIKWDRVSTSLHCFQQLGMGVWPYEYWLDDGHRLVMVVTGPRVYILKAEEGGGK
jgi:hypothetical protein